jgi:Do/DeqQ family serine protease
MTMNRKMIAGALTAILMACALNASAHAQDSRRVPPDAISLKSSFAPIVRKTAPAVVNVFSTGRVQRPDPFWQQLGRNVPRELVEQSLGSGAIVRADGLVITNHHVIENMTEIHVVLNDRRTFSATVLLDDTHADLAVLKIDPGTEKLPVLAISAKDDLEVGDLVLAIGNPFGVGQTVTNGIVSALARTDTGINEYGSFIQTDAAINPGNSGGPLVDMDGELVGLNSAIFSQSGSSAGVGFAIPAATVRQVIESAASGQHSVARPWLGARVDTLTPEMAQGMGLNLARGVLIRQVWPGSSADHAGLKVGDVLTAVNGLPVDDPGAVTYRIGAGRVGDNATFTWTRAGKSMDGSARLALPSSAPAPDQQLLSGQHVLDGATVANLSPALAEEKGLNPFAAGVVIITLRQGVAAQLGLRPGDMILGLNGQKTPTVQTLQATLTASGGRRGVITVNRDGQTQQLQFSF